MNPIVQIVAQIVNFLLFVYILHRLLIKPVRGMMKQRREAMEAARLEAEKKLREAAQIRADADRRAQELEQQRDAVLKEAADQAEESRKEVLQRAEDQARDRLKRFRRVMEQERTELLEEVTGELRDTVVHVAGSVLDKASGELTDRALDRVEELLGKLSDDDVRETKKALAEADGAVSVQFAGTLSDSQMDRLRKALAETFGVEQVELEVDENPDLLAGISVTAGNMQLDAHWRMAIDEALQEQGPKPQTPVAEAEAQSEKTS